MLFTDASGRTWRVSITCGTVWRIREQLGLNLLAPHEGQPPLWQRLQSDPSLFVDALFIACGATIAPAFARSLRGTGFLHWWRGADLDELEPAKLAFFGAWAEFWPEPPKHSEPSGEAPDVDKTIWHLAGIVGVHPDKYTLRQIVLMAEGCGRASWAQTSLLAAPLWNQIRDPKKRRQPFLPDDFNPYAEKKKPNRIKVPLSVLRDLFVKEDSNGQQN